MTVHLPFDLLIKIIRRLARYGEYRMAETLSRYALACDPDDPSARRWLEFSLEAQGAYTEACLIHIEKKSGEGSDRTENIPQNFK